MPRAVVPPNPRSAARRSDSPPSDGLPEKLVKYVPAETLAFFVPTSAVLGSDHDAVLAAAIAIGAVGTAGYLWLAARNESPDRRPRRHFYPLAVVAFLCWALGTSANVMDMVGIDATASGAILGFAIFLVPLADGLLNEVTTS